MAAQGNTAEHLVADTGATVGAAHAGAAAMVRAEVLRAVYEGRYAPGDRLTEAALTRQHQVSRSSVREALSRLAAEGIVTVQRYKGAVIRLIDTAELLDILAVLDGLIPMAARFAAEKIERPGNRAMAETELRRMVETKGALSPFDLARERNHFYRALLQLAGNRELSRLMGQVHTHQIRLRVGSGQEWSLFADYVAMLAAILAGDPHRAAEAARTHVAGHRTHIEQADAR